MARAYHDGRFLDESSVAVGPWDAGLTVGDGVFETLLVVDGRAVDVEAHLDRLAAGLRAVQIDPPESTERLAAIVAEVAAEAPRPQARLRITVTRGGAEGDPTRIVAARAHTPLSEQERARGVAVVVLRDRPIVATDPLRGVKSTSYQAQVLGHRWARSRGGFEGLTVDERGRLCEGTRSNVVVQLGGVLLTPPLADGCLPGTVRRRLLEAGLLQEGSVEAAKLPAVEAMMLTGSLIGVLPVRAIDGRLLAPGEAWRRLYAAWRQLW